MSHKINAVIDKDAHVYYACAPALPGCQSQGDTLDEAAANIREAIELYMETLSPTERAALSSEEILTTSVTVNVPALARLTASEAVQMLMQAGFTLLRSSGECRTFSKGTTGCITDWAGHR